MKSEPRVLVTDAGRGSAVSVIRSLGRSGLYVIAADSEQLSPGLYSRFAKEQLRYPPPRTAPGKAVETLLREAEERHVDLLIPVTDEIVLPLSEARERFEGVCALAIPDRDALAAAADKMATLELARSLGVPTPRTALVATTEEARTAAPQLGWPVVLKPQTSRLYRSSGVEAFGVRYATSADGLEAEMRRLEGRCSVLLQEYVRGEGHGVELLLQEGRPLAAFQHRRLREVPLTGGASSFRESVELDPTLYDFSVRMLAGLGWTGLAMVEFKLAEGGARLMEVNGRIWGSLPLAVKSGMDFPARLAELYLSGPPPATAGPDTSYAAGVRSRNLELEVTWILSVLLRRRRYPFLGGPRRRDALSAALRLLSPADGFDILSLDDPRPGIAEIAKIVRKLGRKLGDGG